MRRGGKLIAALAAACTIPATAFGAQATPLDYYGEGSFFGNAVRVSPILTSGLPLPGVYTNNPVNALVASLPDVEPLDVEVAVDPAKAQARVTDRRGLLLIGSPGCGYVQAPSVAACPALYAAIVEGSLLGDVVTVRGRARDRAIDVRVSAGDDRVHARDGYFTRVDCGAGNDVAVLDAYDSAVGCESAQRP